MRPYLSGVRYFDYNATSPLAPVARKALLEADQFWYNPSSPYRAAAAVRSAIERKRSLLSELLGCKPERIVFTSGATEANNAVLAYHAKKGYSIAVSSIEHSSVYEPATKLYDATLLPVCSSGSLDTKALDLNLDTFVSVMAANNETGVLQPWNVVFDHCVSRGKVFHCDATQVMGKIPFDQLIKIPWLSASAHKFGGPKGCGFLLIPEDEVDDFHISMGGVHENGHRAGTENYASIAAMVEAFEDTVAHCGTNEGRDIFLDFLKKHLPDIMVHGEKAPRLWNTVNVALPIYVQHRWINRLDKAGFLVSAGSACSSGKTGGSHVLKAMNVSDDVINRSIRISSGHETTIDDWLALGKAIVQIWEDLKKESASNNVIQI